MNSIPSGDMGLNVIFQLEDQGRSADISISCMVNNGLSINYMHTNNSVKWYSPSNSWIKNGDIIAHSEFYIIDVVQWDASGYMQYNQDQYSFQLNDIALDGNEVFLTYGNGQFDVKSANLW